MGLSDGLAYDKASLNHELMRQEELGKIREGLDKRLKVGVSLWLPPRPRNGICQTAGSQLLDDNLDILWSILVICHVCRLPSCCCRGIFFGLLLPSFFGLLLPSIFSGAPFLRPSSHCERTWRELYYLQSLRTPVIPGC